jgi:hypothetical protein
VKINLGGKIMGVKLFNTHKDYTESEWKIEVIDTSFSGTPTEVRIEQDGAVFEFDGQDTNIVTDGIRPSTCSFGILVDYNDTALINYLNAIVLYPDQKLFCNVYLKVGSDYVLKWRGVFNQSGFEFPDIGDFSFQMTANDGLVRLQDEPFTYATLSTTPTDLTLLETLKECLKFAGNYDLYEATDCFVASSLDIFESRQRKTYEMLFDTRVTKQTWISNSDENTPYNCGEIIQKILTSVGAHLIMWEGRWNIFRVADLRKTTYTYKRYTSDLSHLSNETITTNLSFPIAGTRYPFTEVQYTFDLAYQRATVNWDLNSIISFVKTDMSYTALPAPIVSSNFLTAAKNIRMDFNVLAIMPSKAQLVSAGILSGGRGSERTTTNVYRVAFRISVTFGGSTFYLERRNGVLDWQRRNRNSLNRPEVVYDVFTNGQSTQTITSGLTIPYILGDYSTMNITLRRIIYKKPSGTTGISSQFTGKMTLKQVVPNSKNEQVFETTETATTENISTGSLFYKSESDIFLGDAPIAIANGAMQVYTGSSWVSSRLWEAGGTSYTPFLNLYTRELMRTFYAPLYKCTGVFFMNTAFDPLHTITWRGRVLFFNAGKFSTRTCEYDGEFVQVSYSATSRPVNRRDPGGIGFVRNVRQDFILVRQDINALKDAVGGVTNEAIRLRTDVDAIAQTRSLNADKYIIQNVGGIPDIAAVDSVWPLKAVVSDDGIKLQFFSS